MKVLTLHQPWASLIALGVKTIETRSWSTQYRGPLAIHAAARRSEPDLALHWTVLRAARERGAPCSKPGCGHGDGAHACQFTRTRCFSCNCDGWRYGGPPLGAIVATCTLVDVVPIVGLGEETAVRRVEVGTMGGQPNLMLCAPDPTGEEVRASWGGQVTLGALRPHPEAGFDFDASDYYEADVTDQRPYGDFTPGRYAWLLADIVPVDPPVPFKGGQGLTKTWEPVAA